MCRAYCAKILLYGLIKKRFKQQFHNTMPYLKRERGLLFGVRWMNYDTSLFKIWAMTNPFLYIPPLFDFTAKSNQWRGIEASHQKLIAELHRHAGEAPRHINELRVRLNSGQCTTHPGWAIRPQGNFQASTALSLPRGKVLIMGATSDLPDKCPQI